MDPASDAHVANAASSNVVDLPPVTERVVTEAVDEGETTYRGYHEPNLHDEYVVRDGEPTYYGVDVEAGEHTETTGYRYEVAFGDDVPTPAADDRVVDLAALPKPDRESFLAALGPKAKIRKAWSASFGVTFAYADETTRERSAFAPRTDVEYVRWQGTEMRVAFEEERSVQVVTYTVVAQRVAESTTAFVDRILEERGVVLDALSADQRDIVEQAIDEGYDACEPYADPFQGLLDRLSTDEYDFASFVRYDGEWYAAHVSQWVE